MKKNVMLAVMMTIIVCAIMLGMYYINNRFMHAAPGKAAGHAENIPATSGLSPEAPLTDIHFVLSFKPGL